MLRTHEEKYVFSEKKKSTDLYLNKCLNVIKYQTLLLTCASFLPSHLIFCMDSLSLLIYFSKLTYKFHENCSYKIWLIFWKHFQVNFWRNFLLKIVISFLSLSIPEYYFSSNRNTIFTICLCIKMFIHCYSLFIQSTTKISIRRSLSKNQLCRYQIYTIDNTIFFSHWVWENISFLK